MEKEKEERMEYKLILASNSPRRRELLGGLDIPFEVRVLRGIDESYPETLPAAEVAQYIAEKKAAAYKPTLQKDELIITADTVVIVGDDILGKPHDAADAVLEHHQLDVTFKQLTDSEIQHYVKCYRPFDKAGAYGIQEWIGYIGVTGLNGSYYNVMGLPVQRIYTELQNM